jgi:gas vesicle protein
MSFQPINVDFLINAPEVKVSSEKVKKSLMDIGYTAEEAEKKINQKMNAALERQAFKTMPALQQQGVRTQRVWNGLGNSINQLSREIPAFAVNAQTGFLAISNNLPILADEIQRIRDKNAALTASGKDSVPVWKQVVKGLLSWQTALSVGVALLTIYGKDIVNWIGTLFKGTKALDELASRQEAVNKAFESTAYKKTISELFELTSVINLAKKGLIDKEVALDKYNDTLGDVVGETDDLNVAENNVINKAPAYIKAMLFKVAAMEAAKEAAINLAESQKEINKLSEEIDIEKERKKQQQEAQRQREIEQAKQGSTGVTVTDSQGDRLNRQAEITQNYIDGLNEDISEIEKKRDEVVSKSQSVVDKLFEQSAKIASAAGLDIFGTDDDDKDPVKKVSQYQSLMDKIAAIDAEYTRKSFTKEEEELQALKDKFAKIRTLVERFNADPKNKAEIIDLTAFNALEGTATSDLVFRQETDALKKELQEQKNLYKEFEDYKKTFGETAAKEEYASKITEAETYYDFLKQLEKDNATAFSAVKNSKATGGQTERVNFINKELKKATKEQQTEFNKQLADLISYHQQRKILIEQHQQLVLDLIAKGEGEKVKQANLKHKEELDALDDTNIKKLASYKALQRGIISLTKREAKLVIANAKQLLNKVNISDDLRAKIKKAIANLEREINQQSIDNLFRYTERLGDFGTALQDIGDVLGSSDVKNAGAFLSGIAGGLDDFFNALDAETKEQKIAAGIGAAISLISVFASAAAKRKQAEEEYYLNVIGFQNQYNLGLQEQKRLQSELAENVFMTDYVGRLQDGTAAIFSANEGLQTALNELAEKGQAVTGKRNSIGWGNVGGATAAGAALGSVIPVVGTLVGAIGGFIGGLLFGGKKKDEMTAILKEYPELIEMSASGMRTVNAELAESLIANKLVKGETKEILENVIAWQEELQKAKEQIKEVIADLAGSLGDDLRNTLVEAFVAGEDAAVKMGETVEKVLENVLSNFIFNQIFQQAFDDLQKQMAASFDLGGDNNWVDDFSRFFTSASALTDDFNKAMEDAQAEAAALGFSIFDNATNNNALTGGIRRELTEQTGTELLGLFRGFYDLTRFNLEQMEAYIEAEKGHHNTTLEILAMNTLIEANTREMILHLKKGNEYLESIDETTESHYLFIQ